VVVIGALDVLWPVIVNDRCSFIHIVSQKFVAGKTDADISRRQLLMGAQAQGEDQKIYGNKILDHVETAVQPHICAANARQRAVCR
jgi:hypothetical protein